MTKDDQIAMRLMIGYFEHTVVELDAEVAHEESRTRISDRKHVAYSTLATATALRSTKLLASIETLRNELANAAAKEEEIVDGTPAVGSAAADPLRAA